MILYFQINTKLCLPGSYKSEIKQYTRIKPSISFIAIVNFNCMRGRKTKQRYYIHVSLSQQEMDFNPNQN